MLRADLLSVSPLLTQAEAPYIALSFPFLQLLAVATLSCELSFTLSLRLSLLALLGLPCRWLCPRRRLKSE